MALSDDVTYRNAVLAAEATRQGSKSSAFTTYAYNPSNLAAYIIALNDADAAYMTAVNTAANTLNTPVGNLGYSGPILGAGWTPLLSSA